MARILIVDDHVLNREFLVSLLGYSGHQLLQAADGEEGLRQVHLQRPHLIIADVLMPNMDGYEFVARLREDPALADIPVIFYTAAYGEREAQVMARACGVRWVMCKPSDPQQILQTVRDALGEGNHDAPAPTPVAGRARRESEAAIHAQPLLELLQEAENNSQQMSRYLETDAPAGQVGEPLKRMSERLSRSLASLQSVSLRLTALIDLGMELAAERNPEELLHLACRIAHNMSVCNHAAIGILDESGATLSHYVCRGQRGATESPPVPHPADGILGALLEQREAIRLADMGDGAATLGLPPLSGPRSFIGVAIASPSHVYGWLVLADKLGAREFSEVDERIVSTVAAQLAVAWENLVLYRELALSHDHLQREVAQRKQVDEDLRRFRLAMDTTSDAVMLIDPVEVSFIDFNAGTCRLFGYDAQELRQLGPMALGAGTREQLRKLYAGVIQNEREYGQAEVRLQRKDGTPVSVEVQRRALRSGDKWIIVAVAHDLTEREQERERMKQLAHYDMLTGLPNRKLFQQSLEKALAQSCKPGDAVVLMVLDLDRFQKINDTLGHACGDDLLRQVADRLLQSLLKRDTVGRLGADEFGIILSIPDRGQEETVVVERIRAALAPRFLVDHSHTTVTASIGIAVYPDDAHQADVLMKYADTAMHWAKESGRNAFRYFTAEMNRQAIARLDLENALRTAIEQEQFILLFQPKVAIATGLVTGAEVLLRWERPGFGRVAPGIFIPLLEDTGLVTTVGAWVIERTCSVLARWHAAGRAPLQLSFNVSARQFFDAGLEQVILQSVQRHGVDPQLLTLELTESSLMSDAVQSVKVLTNLKRLGLKVALDDFGTGYSSLAYLRRFPIDTLKIDIAFIRELSTNLDDAAIVSAVISMAHSLKLNVVAEGVEEPAQLIYLRDHHCDEVQGYWFSRALDEAEFTALVDSRTALRFD